MFFFWLTCLTARFERHFLSLSNLFFIATTTARYGRTTTTTRSAIIPTRGTQRPPADPLQLSDRTYANQFPLPNFRIRNAHDHVRWKCSFETDFCGLLRNGDCLEIRKDYFTGRVLNSTYIDHGKFSRGKIGAKHTGKKVHCYESENLNCCSCFA